MVCPPVCGDNLQALAYINVHHACYEAIYAKVVQCDIMAISQMDGYTLENLCTRTAQSSHGIHS